MARKIVCSTCNQYLIKAAKEFREFYESIYGESKMALICDDCGEHIVMGGPCWAGVLLTEKSHPNYAHQKPDFWAGHYIIIK